MVCDESKHAGPMKLLFYLTLSALLVGCSRSYSELTVSARNTFVLGEYMTSSFSADMSNRGEVPVSVALVNKREGTVTGRFVLQPGQREKVSVPADREVHIVNQARRDAYLWVELNKGVQGMRAVPLDGQVSIKPVVDKEAEASALKPEGPKSKRFRSDIPPGSCFEIGKGEWMTYEAQVTARRAPLQLRVLTYGGEEQAMAFGLGDGSTDRVTVERGNYLSLCNQAERELTVVVTLDRAVHGGRLRAALPQ